MRIALIGVGVIGKVHLNIINSLNVELVGVCDIDEEKELLSDISQRYNLPILTIINKTDLIDDAGEKKLCEEFSQYDPVMISILSNNGIEGIFEKLRRIFTEKGVYMNTENIITSERHKNLLDSSIDAITKAKESYKNNMPIDCISYDIWECGKFLEKITGKSIEADVVETIFSQFCLGK